MKTTICVLLIFFSIIFLDLANVKSHTLRENQTKYEMTKYLPHGGSYYRLNKLQLITPKNMTINHIIMNDKYSIIKLRNKMRFK